MKIFINFIVSILVFSTALFAEEDKIYSSTECYTIIDKIGEGFFGLVYAVENSRGEKFALKSYKAHPDYLGSSLLGDMEREFRRGQTLNHPNIIKSIDLFSYSRASEEASHNLILQLVEGKTLQDTKRRGLSPEEALKAAKQFSLALSYALSHDLVYLDLHLGNIMLDHQKNVMMIDLASFFAFDEIFHYASSQTKVSEESSKKISYHFQTHLLSTSEALLTENSIKETENPIKEEKLRLFFMRHPKLIQQLQQQPKEKKTHFANHTIHSLSSTKSLVEKELNRAPIYYYYFDSISEICIKIISKSTLNREEKIALRIELKKLVWNYAEDLEEGKETSFEEYFERLLTLLNSFSPN